MRALSNMIRSEPSIAVASDMRSARRVRKVIGIRARPRTAGKNRMTVYGTLSAR